VHDSHAVRLGDDVVCDGFLKDAHIRVQTHIHQDHRQGFDSCKGAGRKIVALPATRDLMIAESDDLLDTRENFIPLEAGEGLELEGGTLRLFDSGHMLGSAQAVFESVDGYRTGYSGDFGWPCVPIEVDELVVDGTSSPRTVRDYSQEAAESALRDLVIERQALGPVVITGDAEANYRTMEVLAEFHDLPVIANKRAYSYAGVYRSYGASVPAGLVMDGTEEADALMAEGRYVLLRSKGSKTSYDNDPTYIRLIPFYTHPGDPVARLAHNCFQVGISNHADFEQTLEYVRGTNASRVLVDPIRGRRAAELAIELGERLAVEVSFDSERSDGGWGS
jgi:putative mRNA 3-end processing factor